MSNQYEFYPSPASRERLIKNNEQWTCKPEGLVSFSKSSMENPETYIADEGLAQAMNVALMLGQPLLLTGEPGVGKTQFAHSARHWLGFDRLLVFNTKSTTQARDFFTKLMK